MSKMMVKRDGLWTPMANLKGDTGPLPADNSVTNDALVTDGAKTNTAYLMGNRLTATAEGEMVSVDDSYPSAALSLTVDGKSTQVTTTGKNLLSDVPSEWVKRTFANLSGTIVSFPISIEDGASYYYVKTTGSGMSPGMYGGFCDALDGTITIYDRVTLSNYSSYTFTNSGSHAYLIFFAASINTTASQITDQFLSRKIFVSANSSDTYEVYSGGAASPRPDWPQEIESMAGSVVTIAKKNLARPTATESSKTAHGVTSSWDGEVLRVSGTADAINVDFVAVGIDRAPILFAGETYTFSLQGTFSIDDARTTFYFYTSKPGEMNETLHWLYGSTGKQNSWTYTTQEDAVLKSFTLRVGGDSAGFTVNIAARFQLELGSAATYYEPYSGVAATIDLSETPLRSLPDGTKDELYLTYLRPSSREGWAWYRGTLTQRVGLLNLDGSESYGLESGRYYIQVDNMKRLTNYAESMLCDHLKVYSKQANIGGVVNFVSGISGYVRAKTYYPGRNWIYLAIEKGMTAADTKQWVSEHPMVVIYLLAAPITTQLDPIELPIMQAGITNIWTDPSTSLSVTYERDRNIVISKLEAAAADLATS